MALQVAVEKYPALSRDSKTICNLLKLNKGMRQGLRRAAGHMSITINQCTNMAALVGWLPYHAGLVKEIHLVQRHSYCRANSVSAQELLAVGLKFSTLPRGDVQDYPAATFSAMATGGQVPLLRLNRFSAQDTVSADTLHALATAQLKCLDLEDEGIAMFSLSNQRCHTARGNTRGAADVLGSMSSLRELSLKISERRYMEYWGPQLEALGHLHIIQLSLCGLPVISDLSCLPTSLRALELSLLDSHDSSSQSSDGDERPKHVLDLTYLTALQNLQLSVEGNVAEGSALPTQLKALTTTACIRNLGVASLRQLQQLSISGYNSEPDQLQQLAARPHLSVLEVLECRDEAALLAMSTCWQDMTQLCTLGVELCELTSDGAAMVVEGIAAATSIKKLKMEGMPKDNLLGLPPFLGRLSHLRELTLVSIKLATDDAMGLTKLTGLTCLELDRCVRDIDDVVAAAVAVRLTNLQHLSINNSLLRSAALLAVLPGLKALRSLDLKGNHAMEITDEALMQLTTLVLLTELGLPPLQSSWMAMKADMSKVVQEFQHAMPQMDPDCQSGLSCVYEGPSYRTGLPYRSPSCSHSPSRSMSPDSFYSDY